MFYSSAPVKKLVGSFVPGKIVLERKEFER